MAEITLNNVTKRYPDGYEAVKDMSLEIQDGEFVILVGPSGCGKSTALRMVAGLEDISDGELRIGDEVVNEKAPKDRDVAMVFQNYALYPHMSVRDNMGFALKLKGADKEEIDRKVGEAARILDLEQHLDRKPAQLSGGQRQRVAMGRAIVRDPAAFLMDEPLSNLDAKLRVQMRAEIARLQNDLKTTTVHVTHDQVEAMTMGDRVAVMRKGEVQQVDPPQDLYDRPVNLFVGGFIGSPAMNMVEATLERRNGGLVAKLGSQELPLGEHVASAHPALKRYEGRMVIVGIRPEDLDDAEHASDRPSDECLRGEVQLRESLGSEIMVHFGVDARQALTDDVRELAKDAGDEAAAEQAAQAGETTLVGRFDPRSRVREGDMVSVAVDTRNLHFFDPETGSGIYDGSQ
jgi:multiple sugar transport system ATP-binding protein